MSSTRAPAVEARQLIKTYPGDVTALSGMDVTVETGTVFGLLGPNGGRQVHHRQDPHHPGPSRLRLRHRGRARRAAPPGPGAPRDRRRRPELRRRPGGHRPGEPPTPGQAVRLEECGSEPPGGRTARPLQARRRGAAPGQGLLGRYAASARRGARSRPPPRGALPRRAHHRTRPRGAHRDVGRDRPPRSATRG